MSYDCVYLSPHLDDAILSCGGRIFQQTQAGQKVLVVTFMSADAPKNLSPFAQRFHLMCALDDQAMSVRRDEDLRACERVAADARHHFLQDAIYRRVGNTVMYPTHRAVLGKLHPADTICGQTLAQLLDRLPAHAERVAPLAIGGHVDHQIVRREAERRWGRDLLYYEDFPYAMKWMAAWRTARPHSHWETVYTPLTEPAVQARIDAIAAYESQIQMLFGGPDRMVDQVRRFVRSRDGERFWRKKAGAPIS